MEVLPYHECDVISRDRPDYLRCLVHLQIQNVSARFPIFVTGEVFVLILFVQLLMFTDSKVHVVPRKMFCVSLLFLAYLKVLKVYLKTKQKKKTAVSKIKR